jgi:hypothetical protein
MTARNRKTGPAEKPEYKPTPWEVAAPGVDPSIAILASDITSGCLVNHSKSAAGSGHIVHDYPALNQLADRTTRDTTSALCWRADSKPHAGR